MGVSSGPSFCGLAEYRALICEESTSHPAGRTLHAVATDPNDKVRLRIDR